MSELAKCPFCGGKCKLFAYNTYEDSNDKIVRCGDCSYASCSSDEAADAIAAHNRVSEAAGARVVTVIEVPVRVDETVRCPLVAHGIMCGIADSSCVTPSLGSCPLRAGPVLVRLGGGK